jgi:hypothetical protein
MQRTTTIALVAAKVTLGAGLALGLLAAPHGTAHAVTGYDAYAAEFGDDNADGRIDEDESGWSCVDNGNRTCGPANPQGVPAGRYDGGGVLIDPWPVDSYAYDAGAYVG